MIAATTPKDRSRGQLVQRWLFGVVLAALVGVMAVATRSFAWPSDAARGSYELGPMSGFVLGSVTGYVINDRGELDLVADVARHFGVTADGGAASGSSLVYVVRFRDGDLRVFSGASTHLGRAVVWMPESSPWVTDGYVGLFIEPSHGEQWTIDGIRVFGPPPRGLDQYAWRIDDGVLVVELNEIVRGERDGPAPPPYDVTSEGWATSGWPSNELRRGRL